MPSPPDPAIPISILGGYLGAGKTTRINRLLAANHNKRIGVIVNDFGSVNIDEHLIDQQGETAIGLTNGCVCCTLADGLGMALDTIAACTPPMEQVVIEGSGIADPERIAAYAQTWPGFRLSEVVVVVDATRIKQQAEDKYIGATVRKQLRAADRICVSHTDVAPVQGPSAQINQVKDWIVNLTGIGRTSVKVDTQAADWLLDEGVSATAQRAADTPGFTEPMHADTHRDQHRTATLKFSTPLDSTSVRALARSAPADLLRVKGWICLADSPATTYRLQGVPGRWHLTPDEATPLPSHHSQIVLVWINESLTEDTIRAAFAAQTFG